MTQHIIVLQRRQNLYKVQSYLSVKIEKSGRIAESCPVCLDP